MYAQTPDNIAVYDVVTQGSWFRRHMRRHKRKEQRRACNKVVGCENVTLLPSERGCMARSAKWGANRERQLYDPAMDLSMAKRFKLVKKLGEGGFGTVTLVESVYDNIKYAVKSMLVGIDKPISPSAIREFDPRNLDHPNVIGYCACGMHATVPDANVYIDLFMDPANSDSLTYTRKCIGYPNIDDMVPDAFIPPYSAEKVLALAQMANGVAYVHSMLAVHSDIKTENFLVDGVETTDAGGKKVYVPHLMLADFGLARAFAPWFRSATSAGTPYMIAPELLLGSGESTWMSDVWSLGCAMYDFVTGDFPVSGDSTTIEDQYAAITKTFGTSSWPGVAKLPYWNYMTTTVLKNMMYAPNVGKLQKKLANYPFLWTGVIERMLSLDPNTRPQAYAVAEYLGKIYLPKYGRTVREVLDSCLPGSFMEPSSVVKADPLDRKMPESRSAIEAAYRLVRPAYVPEYEKWFDGEMSARNDYRSIAEEIMLFSQYMHSPVLMRTTIFALNLLRAYGQRNVSFPADKMSFMLHDDQYWCRLVAAALVGLAIKYVDGVMVAAVDGFPERLNAGIATAYRVLRQDVVTIERRVITNIDFDFMRTDEYVVIDIFSRSKSVIYDFRPIAGALSIQILADPDAGIGLDSFDIAVTSIAAATLSSKGMADDVTPEISEFFRNNTTGFMNTYGKAIGLEESHISFINKKVVGMLPKPVVEEKTPVITTAPSTTTTGDCFVSYILPATRSAIPRDTRTIPLQPSSSEFLPGYNARTDIGSSPAKCITAGMLWKLRQDIGEIDFAEWYTRTLSMRHGSDTSRMLKKFEAWFRSRSLWVVFDITEPGVESNPRSSKTHSGWIVDMPGILDPSLGERYYQEIFGGKDRVGDWWTARDVVIEYYGSKRETIRDNIVSKLRNENDAKNIDVDKMVDFVFYAGKLL